MAGASTSRPLLPTKESVYLQNLDDKSKSRYEEKLSLIGGFDPYTVKVGTSAWLASVKDFPSLTYPDIVTYLVFTKSPYTMEDFAAYKSLEAYNQFVCGWVRKLGVFKRDTAVDEQLKIISCHVLHSQAVGAPPLQPWVIAENGRVLAAHCNCMAGLGEACTHIAAMLFAVESAVRNREEATVTQMECYWNTPSSRNVPYTAAGDIDFTSPKHHLKTLCEEETCSRMKAKTPRLVKETAPTSLFEQQEFFKLLNTHDRKASVLSLIEPYAEFFVPKSVLNDEFSPILTELYKDEYLNLEFHDIIKKCQEVVVQITESQAKNIQRETIQQSKSKAWFVHRAGRITASKMKAVCRTDPAMPSQSLIKSICYPDTTVKKTKAMKWGCSHEKAALKAYHMRMSDKHDDLKITSTGLIINPAHPYMGASPDALVECRCCGKGCVEIKCPYCKRFSTLQEGAGDKVLCTTSETQQLDVNHSFYYQIQTQIHISESKYCDFVLWTTKDMHLERIYPNAEFWDSLVKKTELFFRTAILPELLSKFYTRLPISKATNTNDSNLSVEDDVYCYCRRGDEGSMIACDNQNCEKQWFHFDCLGIVSAPKGKWLCPECRKLQTGKRKKK